MLVQIFIPSVQNHLERKLLGVNWQIVFLIVLISKLSLKK